MIATVYGWALKRAGHDVEFYVRPGRAAAFGETVDLDLLDIRHGVRGQRFNEQWPARYREALEPSYDSDLIVLSVQHYHLPEAAFLAPRVGNATVLVFGNIWSEPLAATGALPAGGFPGAGGGFGEDGALHGTLLPSVVFGTLGQPPSERERAVRQAFHEAGFRLREQPDFRGWLWIHFAQNAGLHSQVLRLGSLARLAGATGDMREALLATRELLPLLAARGVDLRRHRSSVLPLRAPTWLTAPHSPGCSPTSPRPAGRLNCTPTPRSCARSAATPWPRHDGWASRYRG